MPIELIKFKDKEWPLFQSKGGASRWVMALAQDFCTGVGVDIGYSKEEWKMPGAYGIDNGKDWNAFNLPIRRVLANDDKIEWDFIFSSHCLEHVKENWYDVLDHWLMRIRIGGIIFLYLPHKSQEYWLPENNRKHIHSFTGEEIETYLKSLGHKVIRSGVDLNNSFVVVCERVEKEISITDIPFTPASALHTSTLNGISYEAETYTKFKDWLNNAPCKDLTDGGIVSGELLDKLKGKNVKIAPKIQLDTDELSDFQMQEMFNRLPFNDRRELLGYSPL